MTGFAGTTYGATISAADNTLGLDSSTPASFRDGDAWLFYSASGSYPSAAYRPACSSTSRQRTRPTPGFASDVARRADTGNTGTGSPILDGGSRARLFTADNFTRTQEFGVRLKAYLDGPAGKAMYQRFFAATIGPDKLRAACHLYDFAGYSQGYFVTAWGLKSSIYADDTPRFAWWKSL